MAATGTPTPNIGLRRAQGTDPASVDDINYNSALIDTKLGAVGNSSVQDQIDSLNGKITPSWTLLNSSYNLYYCKFGAAVCIKATKYGVGIDSDTDIGQLPAGYRPYAEIRFPAYNNQSAIKVASDGTITVQGTSPNLFFNLSFVP